MTMDMNPRQKDLSRMFAAYVTANRFVYERVFYARIGMAATDRVFTRDYRSGEMAPTIRRINRTRLMDRVRVYAELTGMRTGRTRFDSGEPEPEFVPDLAMDAVVDRMILFDIPWFIRRYYGRFLEAYGFDRIDNGGMMDDIVYGQVFYKGMGDIRQGLWDGLIARGADTIDWKKLIQLYEEIFTKDGRQRRDKKRGG